MHVQSLLTVTGIFCSLVTGLPVQAQRSGSGGVANRLPKLQELPQARPEPQPALPPAVEYEVKARYWRKYPIKEVAGKPKGPPVHHEIFWPHNDNFQKDQRLVDCVMENLDLKFGDGDREKINGMRWNFAITKCDGADEYKVADPNAAIIFNAYKLKPGDPHPPERTDPPPRNQDEGKKFNQSLNQGRPKTDADESKPKPMHMWTGFREKLFNSINRSFSRGGARDRVVPGAQPGMGTPFFRPGFAPRRR